MEPPNMPQWLRYDSHSLRRTYLEEELGDTARALAGSIYSFPFSNISNLVQETPPFKALRVPQSHLTHCCPWAPTSVLWTQCLLKLEQHTFH